MRVHSANAEVGKAAIEEALEKQRQEEEEARPTALQAHSADAAVDKAASASLDGKSLFADTAVRDADTGFAAIGMNG